MDYGTNKLFAGHYQQIMFVPLCRLRVLEKLEVGRSKADFRWSRLPKAVATWPRLLCVSSGKFSNCSIVHWHCFLFFCEWVNVACRYIEACDDVQAAEDIAGTVCNVDVKE